MCSSLKLFRRGCCLLSVAEELYCSGYMYWSWLFWKLQYFVDDHVPILLRVDDKTNSIKKNREKIINCAVYIFEKKIRYETFFPFLKHPKEFVPWNNQITFTFTTISDKFNSVASFRLVFFPGYFDIWYTSSNLHVCTTVSFLAFILEVFSLPEICLTKRIKTRIRKISSDTVNALLIKDC